MIGDKQKVLEYLEKKKDNSIFKCEEIKETRSQNQNRMYWKWLNNLVKCFDNKGIFITSEDLHDGLRDKLIEGKHKKNTFTGELKIVRKTTTQLNKKEFSKYIQDVEKYLWQTFEISYPLPTDISYIDN